MTTALIVKELRQHWLAFLLLMPLLGIGFLLVVGTTVTQDAGSLLDALRLFLIVFIPIAMLVLCNRLVVREYQSKTQLFLEGLPLTRVRMVMVKYFLGLSVIVVAVGGAAAVLVPIAARSEDLTGRFSQILAARTAAFVWCSYSFFFVMGLLGRYRVAIYLLLLLGMMAVDSQTDLELARFGPFVMVNDRFAFERSEMPSQAINVTLALAALFAGLAFTLPLIREGSVATLLAEKMSHREKVFVTVLVLGFVFAISLYDTKKKKQPFDLADALVEQQGDVIVKVSVGASKDQDAARRIGRLVAQEMAAVKEYLHVDRLPPIFLVRRRDLDADQYERGILDGAEGLLVRANLTSPRWDNDHFLAWVVRETLIVASGGRVKLEPNMWVLDGFGLFWGARKSETPAFDIRQLQLRSAYGASMGFEVDDVGGWYRYRERVGEDVAAAVAWFGLTRLQRTQGEQPCRDFLSRVLNTDIPADVRALAREWRSPLPAIIDQTAGIPYDKFLENWRTGLAELKNSRADELSLVPRLSGSITYQPTSELTRTARYRFDCDPPPESGRFLLLHCELPPFDAEVPTTQLKREDLEFQTERTGVLPETFARRTRFYWTFAMRDEQLGCRIITGWKREEMN